MSDYGKTEAEVLKEVAAKFWNERLNQVEEAKRHALGEQGQRTDAEVWKEMRRKAAMLVRAKQRYDAEVFRQGLGELARDVPTDHNPAPRPPTAAELEFADASDPQQKPMVTRREYEQARAVLDVLPAGYYVKCAGPCNGWYRGGQYVTLPGGRGPLCAKCAGQQGAP